MADNFDMKKFLAENKLGPYAKNLVIENQYDDEDEDYDLNAAFKASPMSHSYEDVLDIFKSYEDESILNNFKAKFPEGKDISRKDYGDFAMSMIDDMSEVSFIQANWISLTDDDVYTKAGLAEEKEKLAKEDLGKDLEDTKAADMMDFLAEDETNPKAKKELDAIQKQIVAAQSKLNSFRKVYKDKYNKASKEKQKQLDAALKAAEKDFEKTVTPLEAQSKKLKENKESLNEDASQTVIDILGILAGLAGMGLSGVQILKWQDKLEKENPELHKQLGKVSSTIGGADPSKNLEENEDTGGIENDIEQDLMYTEDPILYLKSIIDFCNKKIEEIEQDTDGIEEAKKEEIKEVLTPEAFERMDALTSTRAQLAMIKAAEIMMNELTKEGFEVLDIREYFTQLIANDI